MGSAFTTAQEPGPENNEPFTVGGVQFKSFGRVRYPYVSYLDVGKFGDEDFLLISAFEGAPWKSGSVAIAKGLKGGIEGRNVSEVKAVTLDPAPYAFESPNNAKKVPDDVFPGEHAIIVPDGFLIPGHRQGSVFIMLQDAEDITKTKKTVKLTKAINNYWYHTGHWVDMNGNGRKDLLIARTNYTHGGGRLVWLEHPEEGALDGREWEEHVICEGPDVFTSVSELPQYPGEIIVWATEFRDERLAFYRISKTDGTLVDKRVIDDQNIHRAYSAQLVDLNGDGQHQLLVNNWQRTTDDNGLWAYALPEDLMTGEFKRYDIATRFPNKWRYFLTQIGGPGYPYVFYPDGQKQGRAHVLLCGHGNEKAWLLKPVGDASKFEYEAHEILDGGAVIPYMQITDIDENGK